MANPPYTEMIPMEIVRLQLKQVGAQMHMGEFMLANLELTERVDHITRDLVYAVKTYVQTQHLGSETYTDSKEIPASWWQHWKQDHQGNRFTRWISRRWPVKSKALEFRVDVESIAAFPDSRVIQDPRLGDAVLWRIPERHPIRIKDI